jgi:outer membrane protein OmpA-like peptidoglycan-associated protein
VRTVDELANKLKADPAGNYIEIEGHTDSTGSTETNEQLGLARAENVKRYLYETYQIPLHKINVISYGESKPAAPNTTRDGRAQNRRVVTFGQCTRCDRCGSAPRTHRTVLASQYDPTRNR